MEVKPDLQVECLGVFQNLVERTCINIYGQKLDLWKYGFMREFAMYTVDAV